MLPVDVDGKRSQPLPQQDNPKQLERSLAKVETTEGHMCRKTVPTPHTNVTIHLRDIKHQQFQFLEKLFFMLAFFTYENFMHLH